MFNGSFVPHWIEKYFYHHANWIVDYKRWFLGVPIVMSIVLLVGWHRFTMERDMTVLFSPGGSRWHHDRLKFEAFFGLNNASMKYLLVAAKDPDGNLFDEPMNSELLKILDEIENDVYVTDDDGKKYRYFPELATPRSPYLGPNDIIKALFLAKEELRSHLRYPVITRAGQTLFLPFAFGGVTVREDDPTKVKRVRCLLMRYASIAKDDRYRDLSDRFETAMFNYANELPANSSLDVSVYSWWSIMNEVRKNTWHTLRYVPPAMFMTLVFTVIVCSTRNWKTSCHEHAMYGLLSVMLSFISALGFLFWLGFYYNDLVSITSFLALAVGVDDTFIMLSAWQRKVHLADKPKKRMQHTLMEGATSITFTSVTDFIAFGVGMSMQVPALRNFCVFTALAIGWDYLYQVTFFPAAMLYAEENRHRWKPLFDWLYGDKEREECSNNMPKIESVAKGKIYAVNGLKSVMENDTTSNNINNNNNNNNENNAEITEIREQSITQVNVNINGSSKDLPENSMVLKVDQALSKKKKKKRKSWLLNKFDFLFNEEILQETFAQWLTSVVMSVPCQFVLFLIYTAVTIFAVIGIANMGLNASFSKLLVDSSPMHRYVDLFERYFWSESNLFHCVVKSPDLRNVTEVKRFYEFVHALESTPYSFGPDSTVLWMKEFYSFVKFFDDLEFDEIPPADVPYLLDRFLGEEGSQSKRDAHFELIDPSDPKSLRLPTKFQFATGFKGLPHWPERAELLKFLTKVTEDYKEFDPAFFHEMVFLTDLLIYTEGGMKQTLGTCLIVTFFITICFLPAGKGSLVFWVTTTFVWINAAVIGCLSWWSVDVDVISMVTVLMSVGFSVDYTVHLAYQFSRNANTIDRTITAERSSHDIKRMLVLETFRSVGFPILLAGLSTLIAVSLMVCVGSYMVRVFLKTLILVVASGLFQSLLMLPLVLVLTEKHITPHQITRSLKRKPNDDTTVDSNINENSQHVD